MICFVGSSHAPQTLKAAAIAKGLAVTDSVAEANLVFVAEDTPTDKDGKRDLTGIRNLIRAVIDDTTVPIVFSSQVPPGFTRSLLCPRVIHMAETLRMKDALERAMAPEQFIFGLAVPASNLPRALWEYAESFQRAVVQIMTYEDAEFAKIAINMFLASQVDTTNRLAKAAHKVGASWLAVAQVLAADRRIGRHAYLTPGVWQDSTHLMRDYVTLEAILAR